jgi:hypothetical protein
LVERLWPMALLLALNGADLLTTHALLARGGVELNPVGRVLISHGALGQAKLAVPIAAGLLLVVRPRRWITNALWYIAGIYTAVIGIHLAQLVTR